MYMVVLSIYIKKGITNNYQHLDSVLFSFLKNPFHMSKLRYLYLTPKLSILFVSLINEGKIQYMLELSIERKLLRIILALPT